MTCHDGFTLTDLVSYEERHNEANGEDNQDGESHNRSFHCGAEGETGDPAVLTCRGRQRRNFLTTLLLSQGVPMLLSGDELGRSQGGNNNAYCQDNEIAWLDWDEIDQELLEFTRLTVRLRRDHPVFRRRRWFEGSSPLGRAGEGIDIAWFRPDGRQMTDADWDTSFARVIGVLLNGSAIPTLDPRGDNVVDDDFYVAFNADPEPIDLVLPDGDDRPWLVVIDTSDGFVEDNGREVSPEDTFTLAGRSSLVLRRPAP